MATTTHYRDPQSLQVNHRIPLFRPFVWLADAGRDLLAHPLASMAYGALVAVLGALVLAYQRHPLFIASAILGFLVIGPVFAAGLCELSRRRSRGEVVNFDTSLRVLVRCRQPLLRLSLILLVVAAAWFAISLGVLYWMHGSIAPPLESTVWGDVWRQLTPPQLAVYATSALVLSVLAFLLTVISVPTIIDREASAVSAMRSSVAAVRQQPLVMLVWALLVCGLVIVGFATWLLGLVIIFPLLGHATWRVYEDCGRQDR
ncbi:MAG: DUF2189 domain-containing protein [Haliea sp.]